MTIITVRPFTDDRQAVDRQTEEAGCYMLDASTLFRAPVSSHMNRITRSRRYISACTTRKEIMNLSLDGIGVWLAGESRRVFL